MRWHLEILYSDGNWEKWYVSSDFGKGYESEEEASVELVTLKFEYPNERFRMMCSDLTEKKNDNEIQ